MLFVGNLVSLLELHPSAAAPNTALSPSAFLTTKSAAQELNLLWTLVLIRTPMTVVQARVPVLFAGQVNLMVRCRSLVWVFNHTINIVTIMFKQ